MEVEERKRMCERMGAIASRLKKGHHPLLRGTQAAIVLRHTGMFDSHGRDGYLLGKKTGRETREHAVQLWRH